MSAHEITKALGGSWHGSYGLVPGPGHSRRDRSVKVMDADHDIIVHSFAGDNWRDIKDAWRRDGLPVRGPTLAGSTVCAPRIPSATSMKPEPSPQALKLWRACQPVLGTTAESYLLSRDITVEVPPSLRFHPKLKHAATGLEFPALVAAVQDSGRRIMAVHRTYLTPHGRKAGVSKPKLALGSLGDGAVRLVKAGPVLGLAEGIEDALSVLQAFQVPCWAALGTRLASVALPAGVVEVQVFADCGEAGKQAAQKAAVSFQSQGKRVVLRYPPRGFKDWNEALQAGAVPS